MLALLRELRGSDLEAIMGELETVVGMDYAQSVEGTRDVKSTTGMTSVSFSLNRNTAIRLQWSIKHAVIKEYRNVDAQKTVKLYEPLFDSLFSKFEAGMHCLVVFTTNYDPAIEVFCQEKFRDYNLCDGFAYDPAVRQTYWHRSSFDSFKLDSNKRNLVLFKIHGSVDWLHDKSTDKIRRGQAMYDAMDSDAYSNVLIYPATRKIATSDPYYSGYEYYQRCCETAKVCLAIGYSFRDDDALTRLRGASSVNDRLQLVLVAPDADKILEVVPIPPEQKLALPFYFGKPGKTVECLNKINILLNRSI